MYRGAKTRRCTWKTRSLGHLGHARTGWVDRKQLAQGHVETECDCPGTQGWVGTSCVLASRLPLSECCRHCCNGPHPRFRPARGRGKHTAWPGLTRCSRLPKRLHSALNGRGRRSVHTSPRRYRSPTSSEHTAGTNTELTSPVKDRTSLTDPTAEAGTMRGTSHDFITERFHRIGMGSDSLLTGLMKRHP